MHGIVLLEWSRICLACVLVGCASVTAYGQHERLPANVPPSLEIEVLDPGVDPLGNPAVLLEDGQVEIPPVVLVHRYYYSGDRSFQGPMLPGGPSILVVQHPKTGERLYVPAQMMPGAPEVTYTKSGITYNYGRHAVMLHFGLAGMPTIKYRSGPTWRQRAEELFRVEEIAEHAKRTRARSKQLAQRCRTTAVGVTADVTQFFQTATLPVQHILHSLPVVGQTILSKDAEAYYAERAAEFRREKANKHATSQAQLDQLLIPTNR